MKKIRIENGIIKRCNIYKKEYCDNVYVDLEIQTRIGSAIKTYPIQILERFFTVFDIEDLGSIINIPCVILIENNHINTIGHFLHGLTNDKSILKANWIDFYCFSKEIQETLDTWRNK